MLPFSREIPGRRWLGFVPNPDEKASSPLTLPIALLAIAGLGILAVSGGAQHPATDAPPPSSAASAAAARLGAAQAAGSSSEAEPAATADPVDDAPDAPAVEAASVATPEAAGPSSDAAAVDGEPEPPPAPEADPEPAPKPEPKPPKPLSATAQKRAERAAVRLRGAMKGDRVKASRESFAVLDHDGETSWADAKAYCAGLNVDGVGGWKLPTRGEARELQRGRAIQRGAYWTRQRAKFDDSIYVHDTRTRRSSAWLEEEIAGVVCVQPRPR
ncbi:MAG: hypothetical protein AAGA54_27335 [Myxococcota bacterium]